MSLLFFELVVFVVVDVDVVVVVFVFVIVVVVVFLLLFFLSLFLLSNWFTVCFICVAFKNDSYRLCVLIIIMLLDCLIMKLGLVKLLSFI